MLNYVFFFIFCELLQMAAAYVNTVIAEKKLKEEKEKKEREKNKSFWFDLQTLCKEGKLVRYLTPQDHANLRETSEFILSKGGFIVLDPDTYFATFLKGDTYFCLKVQEFKTFKRFRSQPNMWFSQHEEFSEKVVFHNDSAKKYAKEKRQNLKRKSISGNDKDIIIFNLKADNANLKKQLKLEKDKFAALQFKTDMELATLKCLLNPVNETADFINEMFNNQNN